MTAVAGWLVLTLLPGALLARTVDPRAPWSWVLAVGAPVGVGTAYAVGGLADRVGMPVPAAVLVVQALLVLGCVALLVRSRARVGSVGSRRPIGDPANEGPWARLRAAVRRPGERPGDGPAPAAATGADGGSGASRRAAERVSWLLLAAAVVLGVTVWTVFHADWVVPPGWDSVHHGFFIKQIVVSGGLDPAVLFTSDTLRVETAREWGYYPLAFNIVGAALHVLSGATIGSLLLALNVAFSGVVLPLGLFGLVRGLLPTHPVVAGCAALAAALPAGQFFVEDSGRLTAVTGVTLVPGAVCALLPWVGGLAWRHVPLGVLAVLGVTGGHTSELPVLVVLAGTSALVACWQARDARAALRWAVRALAAGTGAGVVLAALHRDVVGSVAERGLSFTWEHGWEPREAIFRVMQQGGFEPVPASWLGFVLVIVGCFLVLRDRWVALLGPVLTYVAFALLFVGTATGWWVAPLLATPWYREPQRVSWELFVLGAVPAGITLAAVGGLVGSACTWCLSRWRGRRRGALTRWSGAAGSVVAAGVALAVAVVALPPVRMLSHVTHERSGPVDADSLAAFDWLAENVQGPVLDDFRADGSLWMYVDHGVHAAFGIAPPLVPPPVAWLEKRWLRDNVLSVGEDPCVGAALERYGITYLYEGDAIIWDGQHGYTVDELERSPYFHEEFRRGGASVWRVEPPRVDGECPELPRAPTAW